MKGWALKRVMLVFKWLTLKREWWCDQYEAQQEYEYEMHCRQVQEEAQFERDYPRKV